MNKQLLLKLFLVLFWMPALAQVKPSLNTAGNFTVLAATAINSSGNTVIYDNVGIWPGSTLTGFPPGVIVGSRQINTGTAQTAQSDLTLA
ncbi:MAG TPA: hypothetical protein VK927_02870, partial [Adhaeribacter sp.]|nr:hypothetical protein [Adhaeribacter sp.]